MTKRYYQKSLKFDVLARIQSLPGHVVLRKELIDMGGSRQITRCLKDLVEMGKLIKMGYGVYAKAYTSEFVDRPIIEGGFEQACQESLTKLGVKWQQGQAAQAYNSGQSTQVPVRMAVRLKSRLRRKLSYGNRTLIIEKGINAK